MRRRKKFIGTYAFIFIWTARDCPSLSKHPMSRMYDFIEKVIAFPTNSIVFYAIYSTYIVILTGCHLDRYFNRTARSWASSVRAGADAANWSTRITSR